MAVVMIQEQPEVFTTDTYDALNAKMDVAANPPPGLLAHSLSRGDDGVWRIVDFWESREAMQRFGEERLLPALAEVMRDRGMDMSQAPVPTVTFLDAYDVIIPAGAAA